MKQNAPDQRTRELFTGPRHDPRRYLVEGGAEPHAVGGQGLVFRARRRSDGAVVALKQLTLVEPGEWPVLVERARALMAVEHPSLGRQVDIFLGAPLFGATAPDAEDFDVAYSVMAWVDGQDLTDAIEGAPLATAFEWVRQVGDAVAALHDAGLVHRDIKPSNVRVGPGGATLIDFGIARALGTGTMTRAVGSAGWIPPETHFDGGAIGPAADDWQVAGLASWAVLRVAPGAHESATRTSLLEAALRGFDIRSPRATARQIGAMLAHAPGDRPADLRAWCAGLSARPARRRARLAVVAIAAVTVLAAALVPQLAGRGTSFVAQPVGGDEVRDPLRPDVTPGTDVLGLAPSAFRTLPAARDAGSGPEVRSELTTVYADGTSDEGSFAVAVIRYDPDDLARHDVVRGPEDRRPTFLFERFEGMAEVTRLVGADQIVVASRTRSPAQLEELAATVRVVAGDPLEVVLDVPDGFRRRAASRAIGLLDGEGFVVSPAADGFEAIYDNGPVHVWPGTQVLSMASVRGGADDLAVLRWVLARSASTNVDTMAERAPDPSVTAVLGSVAWAGGAADDGTAGTGAARVPLVVEAWQEGPGVLVVVAGFRVGMADIQRVANNLAPVDQQGWDRSGSRLAIPNEVGDDDRVLDCGNSPLYNRIGEVVHARFGAETASPGGEVTVTMTGHTFVVAPPIDINVGQEQFVWALPDEVESVRSVELDGGSFIGSAGVQGRELVVTFVGPAAATALRPDITVTLTVAGGATGELRWPVPARSHHDVDAFGQAIAVDCVPLDPTVPLARVPIA